MGEFLKYGDRVSALPENLNNREGGSIGGGGNTEDLVIMLKNL